MDIWIFAQKTIGKRFEENAAEVVELQRAIGTMSIDGIEGTEGIQAERSSTNRPEQSKISPVLLCGLALLQPRDFSKGIREQRERILFSWDPPDTETLENEFWNFKRALHNESVLEAEIIKATPMNGFA
jgi:hypothetical protein